MERPGYHYSSRPTRNPFRYLRAIWRLVRNDPSQELDSAAIVEIGFVNTRLGRHFARWPEVIASLKADPRTAQSMVARKAFGPIVLADLATLPEGTLGRVFADHCRERSLDPNLVYMEPSDEIGWFLNHLYQTHDIWHVFTGWGNDLPGEVGLGGFYCAQLNAPTFFGYMLALVLLNVISRKANLKDAFEAFTVGYQTGKRTEPLWGMDWDSLWDVPIEELRTRYGIDRSEIVGEGVRAAA